jgi:hypothetical protein
MTIRDDDKTYCVRCNTDISDYDLKKYDKRNLGMLKFYGFCLDCQEIVFENND